MARASCRCPRPLAQGWKTLAPVGGARPPEASLSARETAREVRRSSKLYREPGCQSGSSHVLDPAWLSRSGMDHGETPRYESLEVKLRPGEQLDPWRRRAGSQG